MAKGMHFDSRTTLPADGFQSGHGFLVMCMFRLPRTHYIGMKDFLLFFKKRLAIYVRFSPKIQRILNLFSGLYKTRRTCELFKRNSILTFDGRTKCIYMYTYPDVMLSSELHQN